MKTLLALAAFVAVTAAFVLPEQTNSLGCQMCELAVKKYEGSVDKDVTGIKKASFLDLSSQFKISGL